MKLLPIAAASLVAFCRSSNALAYPDLVQSISDTKVVQIVKKLEKPLMDATPNLVGAKFFSEPSNKKLEPIFSIGDFQLSPIGKNQNNQWFNIKRLSSDNQSKNYFASVSIPDGIQPEAVVIAAHGLNNDPRKFSESVSEICEGINLILIVPAYSGHDNKLLAQSDSEFGVSHGPVAKEDWLDEHALMYELAEAFSIEYTEAQAEKLPKFLLAFSLGAAISLADFSMHTDDRDYQGALLLSPAIEITKAAGMGMFLFQNLHYLLNTLIGDRFEDYRAIPSANLEDYRDSRATTLAAYTGLAELNKDVNSTQLAKLNNVKIIVSIGDELVSATGIQARIDHNNLSWQLSEMKKDPGAKGAKHLFFSKETAGQNLFASIQEQFLEVIRFDRFDSELN